MYRFHKKSKTADHSEGKFVMNQNLIPDKEADEASTVVITHRVCNEKHADYEKWLEEIAP